MFGIEFTSELSFFRVSEDMRKQSVRMLRKASFIVRHTAIESIEATPATEPSAPGRPVHTRQRGVIKSGKNKGKQRFGQVQRAIAFDVDSSKLNAVIGPRASFVGQAMNAHEFGGEYRGENYPARPTMGPALSKSVSLFGGQLIN